MGQSKKAKLLYEEGCNLYLRLFCEKHDFDADSNDVYWVANDIGGVAAIGDYYVNMGDMRLDIDKDAPTDEFFQWYDYSVEAYSLGLSAPNYKSWLMGCPRQYAEMERIRKMKDEVNKIVEQYNKKQDDTGTLHTAEGTAH